MAKDEVGVGGGRHGFEEPNNSRAYTKIVLASLSAAAAETVTFPIDIIKTRLQIHGQPSSQPFPKTSKGTATMSAFRVASDLLWREGGGAMGMYRGLSPAILRHLFYTPIRIVGYEHLRRTTASDSLLGKVLTGGISGIIAQVVASPADLIKVRMQADGYLVSQGLHPRYAGIVDAFKKIVRVDGFCGLWRGVVPNAQRAFLVNMGELSCYDYAKRIIVTKDFCGDNIYAHTLASIASGLSATTLSCPADVVKTRMMNQATSRTTQTVYKNSFDCLVKTVNFEGVQALWKGFFPTWARLGPWQFVFWVSYEKLRYAAGVSSF